MGITPKAKAGNRAASATQNATPPPSPAAADGKRSASPSAEERLPKVTKAAWTGELPADDAAEDAMETMRHLIPEVHKELPEALASWSGTANAHLVKDKIYEVPPLSIKGTLEEGELSTFKEPWNSTRCVEAVSTTGLYEAALNVIWLDARQTQRLPFTLPMNRPSWSLVVELYNRQFSQNASGLGGVTPDAPTRLFFPVALPAFVVDPKMLEHTCFNEGLHMAGGHGLVFAWYLGMWKALKLKDADMIKRLWEAGLTVTVRVRKSSATDLTTVILDSLTFSESVNVAQLAGTDSFNVFAQKLIFFTNRYKEENPKAQQAAIVKKMHSNGVRFKGAVVNATMYKIANIVFSACDDAVRQQMEFLEWKYGPELVSSSYNKLGRLVQTCQKATSSNDVDTVEEGMLFVLHMMHYVLATGQVRSSKFFTMDVVDKQRDQSQGWYGIALNKMKVLRYVRTSFVDSLQESNTTLWKTLVEDILPMFASPVDVMTLEKRMADDFAGATAAKSPVASQVHDFLLSLYQGEFDASCKTIPAEQSIKDALATCDDDSHSLKPLRDALVAVQRCAATMAVVPGFAQKK